MSQEQERLLPDLKELQELVKDKVKTQDEKLAEFEKRVGDVVELAKRNKSRESLYPEQDVDGLKRQLQLATDAEGRVRSLAPLQKVNVRGDNSVAELAREVQHKGDDVYLYNVISKGMKDAHMPVQPLGQTKMFAEFQSLTGELLKALASSGSDDLADWIPTGMGVNLQNRIDLELLVAAQFPVINPPTNPWEFPYVATKPVAKVVSESTGVTGLYTLTEADRAFDENGPPDANATFSRKKLRALELASREVTEDTFMATLPWLRDQIVYALAAGVETAIINGDADGTHQDYNIENATATDLPERLFDGLRKKANAKSLFTDISAPATNLLKARLLREGLGVHGVRVQPLRYIVDVTGLFWMMSTEEVLTLDKYGPNATVLQGELGRFDNIPIIVSDQAYEVADTGFNAASGNDQPVIGIVDTRRFVRGRWPGLGVETERLKITDQVLVIAFENVDFQEVGAAADTSVAFGILADD